MGTVPTNKMTVNEIRFEIDRLKDHLEIKGHNKESRTYHEIRIAELENELARRAERQLG